MTVLGYPFKCFILIITTGLLLRVFSYWYEMDVVDEEAFLRWKEDISQEYPGKGDALFQVANKINKVYHDMRHDPQTKNVSMFQFSSWWPTTHS